MFCLEHVRAYNAKWDYHVHMGPEAVEAEIRRMATWDRPTWPMGKGPGGARTARAWTRADIKDPLDLGAGTDFDVKRRKAARRSGWAADAGLRTEERRALKVFDIDGPVTLAELKIRYKDLVKTHHPDRHGGSGEAEARMKAINAAYEVLCAALRRLDTTGE